MVPHGQRTVGLIGPHSRRFLPCTKTTGGTDRPAAAHLFPVRTELPPAPDIPDGNYKPPRCAHNNRLRRKNSDPPDWVIPGRSQDMPHRSAHKTTRLLRRFVWPTSVSSIARLSAPLFSPVTVAATRSSRSHSEIKAADR